MRIVNPIIDLYEPIIKYQFLINGQFVAPTAQLKGQCTIIMFKILRWVFNHLLRQPIDGKKKIVYLVNKNKTF